MPISSFVKASKRLGNVAATIGCIERAKFASYSSIFSRRKRRIRRPKSAASYSSLYRIGEVTNLEMIHYVR